MSREGSRAARVSGALMFARYAYPPNALGYCGPNDPDALLGYADRGETDPGLRHLARSFEGAKPYLRLIAMSSGIMDPLDLRVVEAYWIGNRLLDLVDPVTFAGMLDDGFGPRAGARRARMVEAALSGGRADHAFHVMCVYPWTGLLRGDAWQASVRVLERCRIRSGVVADVYDDRALVRLEPIAWDGERLTLGPESVESLRVAVTGRRLAPPVRPGDLVAMHWDWVCDRLTDRQARELRSATARALAIANAHSRALVLDT